ncbi:SDR family oxidoreductase [Asticcacaulis sp. AND118]|uniref:SDR family NAD(P)-dependent oxidoreductase n=1 Tax=Asticcacaulis sp. AND118 TaxID=2840468 RepID=UPI001CFFC682|nr:SDR family NAD(P)-dependent oxidoreductase [Asticcacaulis sp. AND118]UDF04657.1 SDR family NAD(P)-dependent oxidoreductase [Asticcacaulis sp. AND118]
MTHPVFTPGKAAVITGGASGIGLAAAIRFAALGLKLCLVDMGADRLEAARTQILSATPDAEVRVAEVDVSDRQALDGLAAILTGDWGGVDVLMNNAGIGGKGDVLGSADYWRSVLEVNLWGVINGVQAFAPAMIDSGRAGLIINTGSKQGITTPPGNPAYNVSKAGVKVFTEALEHQLRNTPGSRITAHLLIPGFVHTGMTGEAGGEKPAGAWTSGQTVDFMMSCLSRGDFYILCPDNDVSRELDEKRMKWAMEDVIENRPPLSRWHPDWAEAFKASLN